MPDDVSPSRDLAPQRMRLVVGQPHRRQKPDGKQLRQHSRVDLVGLHLRFGDRPRLLRVRHDHTAGVLLDQPGRGRQPPLPSRQPPLRAGSIILTTNRGIASWGEIFDDTTVATAILDRLLHHGTVLTINGPSYWMRRHQARVETLRAGLQATKPGD
jgi:hypothetical protein